MATKVREKIEIKEDYCKLGYYLELLQKSQQELVRRGVPLLDIIISHKGEVVNDYEDCHCEVLTVIEGEREKSEAELLKEKRETDKKKEATQRQLEKETHRRYIDGLPQRYFVLQGTILTKTNQKNKLAERIQRFGTQVRGYPKMKQNLEQLTADLENYSQEIVQVKIDLEKYYKAKV